VTPYHPRRGGELVRPWRIDVHAAADAELGDKKDDEPKERLVRIEALLQQLTTARG
jgi:hypothetical protein